MIVNQSVKELSSIRTQDIETRKRHDTCVVLHLYYPEMWAGIRSYLSNLGQQFDLFVTIPYDVNISESVIWADFPQAHVYRCENRGRDVAPFLAVFSAISKLGYKYICKIHTKKSQHIVNGSLWQEDMLVKLLGSPERITQIKAALQEHPDWGMIGPQGHVVPHNYFWHKNAGNVIRLANTLDISTEPLEFSYVAGSMFWLRPEALLSILRLDLRTQDFEPEEGQIDATLAHALERCFGMVVNHSGYEIAESSLHEVRLPEIPFQFSLLIGAFQQLEQTVSQLNGQVTELNGQIAELHGQVSNLSGQVSTLKGRVSELTWQVSNKERELDEIYRSKAWRLVQVLRRIRLSLIPLGSTRARLARGTFEGLQLIRAGGFSLLFRTIREQFRQSAGKRFSRTTPLEESISTLPEPDPYVPLSEEDVDPSGVSARVIAFYLPQFHPIPENDEWWGRDFTEWTNVRKAVPNFRGHYQPRIPDELGYYDLRDIEVQRRQVELAKNYGVYGFCFYYYWFSGKRLLEHPINQYLAHPELDLPFCLCWANENWTRRWDGAEHEILIAQDYNEQEYEHFIRDIAPHFSDPRYIRVEGKPILLVYRINLIPDPQRAVEIWRAECRSMGIGEIFLVAVQSFGISDPRPFGFDAAVEFPPSYLGQAEIGKDSVSVTNPKFKGRIFDYNTAARLMINRQHQGYVAFKAVMPAWDNTARRQNEAHIFINSSPAAYQGWLEKAISYTERWLPEDKRLIFVNAWNEWAEGTHLEPDSLHGYAYLQATADALQKKTPPGRWTLLFVSHDANKGGAQQVLINTIAWFKKHTNINLKVLCLQGGEWLPRLEELADTLVLNDAGSLNSPEDLVDLVRGFCEGAPDLIYGNTIVAGSAYGWLSKLDAPLLTHLHELQSSIQKYGGPWISDAIQFSSHFIACSGPVQENLVANYGVPPEKISTIYSSIVSTRQTILDRVQKKMVRRRLGLEPNKVLIFGCGIGMPFRKGADLFIRLGEALLKTGNKNFHLYWIGNFDPSYEDPGHGRWQDHVLRIRQQGLSGYVTFLGFKENPREYLSCGDIFVLPSREDPFALVALEAADCGLPIVCFDNAGGIPDFVGEDAGYAVPLEDVQSMSEKVALLMENQQLRETLGQRAWEKLIDGFTPDVTTPHILSVCRRLAGKKPTVSVIVPNYNHAPYLEQRLKSIFDQTFKDYEVILLDDASSDQSLGVLNRYASQADTRIVQNEKNSGSPFQQWLKGIDLASSDLLWVAESDDACAPNFLQSLLPAFADSRVQLAYANSHIMNEDGEIIGDYLGTNYLSSLSTEKWKRSYKIQAEQEINDGLGIKNTILNISAVLVRRFEMDPEFRETLRNMRIAGDWYFIIHAIKHGYVVYDARKLNSHRRHSKSVIAQTVSDKRIQEFFHEFFLIQRDIIQAYCLHPDFVHKWESYLREQWNDFTGGKPFAEISVYYPFEAMKREIITLVGATHVE